MAEWLNIITFGLLIFWNIIEIIKSIKINLTYYKITTIPLNKESYKFVNVCYLIGIIAFVFYIRNSIYTIIDMNKYEIPLLTRIATSKLMLWKINMKNFNMSYRMQKESLQNDQAKL